MHYNGANSYLFFNGVEIHKFKAKVSEINAVPLYLGKVSRNYSLDNMEKIVSMNNQEYIVRPEIMNINSNEPLFYPYCFILNLLIKKKITRENMEEIDIKICLRKINKD